MVRHADSAATEAAAPSVDPVQQDVPFGVRLAGAFSWRMLAVAGAAAVVIYLVILLHIVVIPLLVATLLAGLLMPLRNRLARAMPRGLGAAITFITLVVAIAGLVVLVVFTVRSGIGNFSDKAVSQYKTFLAFLNTAFGVSQSDVNAFLADLTKQVEASGGKIASGALTGASTVGDLTVGLLLSLFITLFFLIDGEGIWRWIVRLAPRRARAAVDGAGRAAWLSVGEYARVQVIVAAIDAIGIGLGAFILGVPFAFPIAVLVFLGAFIPIVGAVSTGGLAVVLALVYNNPINAVVMLGVVILVNQIESHLLQPLLMGGAVRLHPIAVVISVAGGSVVGGIAGAVFAVPLVAATNSLVKYLAGGQWKQLPEPPTGPVPEKPEGGGRPRRRRKPQPQDVTTVA